MSHANLAGANFQRTNLSGADLGIALAGFIATAAN
ncbi:pentapeptide repeat-containing protein [Thermocoleostomius sinensis]|nr:pentapeptide repeat-containing protein [Thermocoleostomius sinensis]